MLTTFQYHTTCNNVQMFSAVPPLLFSSWISSLSLNELGNVQWIPHTASKRLTRALEMEKNQYYNLCLIHRQVLSNGV